MTLPEDIDPGDPGHIGHHEELHRTHNAEATIVLGPGATEEDIAAALGDVQAVGGGTVRLTGNSYTIAGLSNPALDIHLPTVDFDMGGAVLNYTGSGVCLRVRMNPFTIDNAGAVRNGTIDGTGASAGAVGIETGSVIRHGWHGVAVQNFIGTGSKNWDFNNAASGTWMERCRFSRCDSRNGTVLYGFRAHGSSPSFLYNDFSDLRFGAEAVDQTVLVTVSPAQLFDCFLGLRGNVNNGATVFDLASTSIVRPDCHISIEQTIGLDAVLFALGSDQILYPSGSIQVINFPDFSAGLQIVDYEGRGSDVTLVGHIVNRPEDPLQGFGLSVGTDTLGVFAAVYDGGVGADLALLKIPFGGGLADARVAAQLDSVTKAEIGFRPGVFTSGSRPAASAVPAGTMIYISDVSGGIPVWSTGSAWHDAAGSVA